MKKSLLLILAGLSLVVGLCWSTGVGVNDLEWLVVGFLESVGLETEVVVPERPASVPETAVWAGGVDGGAWFDCMLASEMNANWCTLWDDQDGEVWARTYFVLRETGEPVPEKELMYSSFSGTYIELVDGRILEPLKLQGGGVHDAWESTPIDPPRVESPESSIDQP